MQKDIKPIQSLLQKPSSIVITTHHKPDGDALGSSLALYHYLKAKNHEVSLISPSDFPNNFEWMPGIENVLIYTENSALCDKKTKEASLIFGLDFNHTGRVQRFESTFLNSNAIKIMIDHHLNPQGFDQYRYWDDNACSTAELVYKFICDMGDETSIDEHIATCIYTGILTDTGSFRFESAGAETYRIAANLIDRGVKHWLVHQWVFDSKSEHKLRFLGYALFHKLTILPEFETAYISITKDELKKFEIKTGDTDGLVNYALSIKDVKLAALIIDRSEQVKISIRSIGDIPANEICNLYFDGGGHKNAAGGQSNDTLEGVIQTLVAILPKYKQLILNN